jgi:hypothetical protein
MHAHWLARARMMSAMVNGGLSWTAMRRAQRRALYFHMDANRAAWIDFVHRRRFGWPAGASWSVSRKWFRRMRSLSRRIHDY